MRGVNVLTSLTEIREARNRYMAEYRSRNRESMNESSRKSMENKRLRDKIRGECGDCRGWADVCRNCKCQRCERIE
jgi:hypothetical protein